MSVQGQLRDRADRQDPLNIQLFFQRCSGFLNSLSRRFGATDHQEILDEELIRMVSEVQNLCEHLLNFGENELTVHCAEQLEEAMHLMLNYQIQRIENTAPLQSSYTAPVTDGRKGRPSYIIEKEQLEYLFSHGFRVSTIVNMNIFGPVSKRTLYRKMKEHRLQIPRTDISEESLLIRIQHFNSVFPNSGYREIKALLETQDPPIRVSRNRVRNALRSADPLGTSIRWAHVISRRKYRVEAPNSLWHVDTNHALSRWAIVVHAGIDGFSRLIPYASASNNNKARTALVLFLRGVRNFGLPERVRTDKGGENVHIGRFMNRARGEHRGSHLTGPSVHNQRIERLWRDIYCKVLSRFYVLFYHMEEHGLLDPLKTEHVFALQTVFIPRINNTLKSWICAHNHHPVTTEHNKTPMQLFLAGMLNGEHLLRHAVDALDYDFIDYFAINWDLEDDPGTEHRHVMDVSCIGNRIPETLFSDMNFLEHCENDVRGMELYVRVLRMVEILFRESEL